MGRVAFVVVFVSDVVEHCQTLGLMIVELNLTDLFILNYLLRYKINQQLIFKMVSSLSQILHS